jgi:hypothetical protein
MFKKINNIVPKETNEFIRQFSREAEKADLEIRNKDVAKEEAVNCNTKKPAPTL